ncbi:MAG: signal peptidase II [Calditrichaeota bacterium]|nr:MAG: signal peptidase II [Calditrichota bacterium]
MSMRFLPTVPRLRLIVFLASGVFIFDQLTKLMAKWYLAPRHSIALIGNFLRLTYVENPGMAFGITIGNRMLFNLLSIAALGIILFYIFKMHRDGWLSVAFAVILGGALGNLFDRLVRGRVIDFIDVDFFDLHFAGKDFWFIHLPPYSMERWPVFNLADIAVSTGMIIIVLYSFLTPRPAPDQDYAVGEDT